MLIAIAIPISTHCTPGYWFKCGRILVGLDPALALGTVLMLLCACVLLWELST